MNSKITTRFAPSPTGYLHIGGVRTALFCYLYAKKHNGEFVLRIEDTDTERSTPEATQAILDGMAWLGLNADKAPIFQTHRFDIYKEKVQWLLDQNKAYRCNCSKERLEALRNSQQEKGEKPRYDGHCLQNKVAESEENFVVRFNNPKEGSITLNDLVYGDIVVNNSELDDLIIQRTDGAPTYNFTVVVDDMLMGISHVIRGDDHINNTFRQINIYHAFGATLPAFAHLPMINGDDGKKLSKRHGAVSVLDYKNNGYVPQAVLNYLIRLGWSHGDQEIFSMDEMIELFDFDHVSKSSASFNTEKLNWLNQQYLKTMPAIRNVELFRHCLVEEGTDAQLFDDTWLASIIEVYADKCHTLSEMAKSTHYLYSDALHYDENAVNKFINDESLTHLSSLKNHLETLADWNVASLGECFSQYIKSHGLKFPQLAQPVRIALTGSTQSPSIDQTLFLLGREDSLSRIEKFLSR